ncbi:hypothetical protein DFH94DRAFT_728512, partial [Russula ochroleuca]
MLVPQAPTNRYRHCHGSFAFMRPPRDGSPHLLTSMRSLCLLFLLSLVHRLLPRRLHGIPVPLILYFSELITIVCSWSGTICTTLKVV